MADRKVVKEERYVTNLLVILSCSNNANAMLTENVSRFFLKKKISLQGAFACFVT